SSIVMLMSVISTHYDLSRISVGHYNAKNGRLLSTSRFFILSSSATEADQGKVSLPHYCPAFTPSSVTDDRGLATGLSK
ncbi:hypothetical protein ACE4ZV_25125, partial [Salmonella enterica]|uniref:hypothetical protein n=1 Tax=Salmonella enterica TaxID=28901 RepID=UPI003D27C119